MNRQPSASVPPSGSTTSKKVKCKPNGIEAETSRLLAARKMVPHLATKPSSGQNCDLNGNGPSCSDQLVTNNHGRKNSKPDEDDIFGQLVAARLKTLTGKYKRYVKTSIVVFLDDMEDVQEEGLPVPPGNKCWTNQSSLDSRRKNGNDQRLPLATSTASYPTCVEAGNGLGPGQRDPAEQPKMEPVQLAEVHYSTWDLVVDTFEAMNLKENLLLGIQAFGFEKPTAVQKRAIVPCCKGRDVIVQVPSGTDRTAAYVISILQRIDHGDPRTQALVLVPSREMAEQVTNSVLMIGDHMVVSCITCIGGTPVRVDVHRLERGAQIVVGTAGRIHDLINRQTLKTDAIKMFLLDEAVTVCAELQEQLYSVFRFMPSGVQVVLLSASVYSEVLRIASRYMKDPLRIVMDREDLELENVRQFCLIVKKRKEKLDLLIELCLSIGTTQAVVFCNSRKTVDLVVKEMTKNDLPVAHLLGTMLNRKSDQVIRDFRSIAIRFLITAVPLPSGIEMGPVFVAINYELPVNRENFINRISRFGQSERKGLVINFVTKADKWTLDELESYYHIRFEEMPDDFTTLID